MRSLQELLTKSRNTKELTIGDLCQENIGLKLRLERQEKELEYLRNFFKDLLNIELAMHEQGNQKTLH